MKKLLIGILAISSISAFANELNCSFKLKYASGDDSAESKTSEIEVNGQSVGRGINKASVSLTSARANHIEYIDKNLLVNASGVLFDEAKGTYLLSVNAQKEAGAKIIAFSGVLTNDRPMIAEFPLKNKILPSRTADFLQVKCDLKN